MENVDHVGQLDVERRQNELIEEAIRVGHGEFETWSIQIADGSSGSTGFQVIHEALSARKSKEKSAVIRAESLFQNGSSPSSRSGITLAGQGIYEITAVVPVIVEKMATRTVQRPIRRLFITRMETVLEDYPVQVTQTMADLIIGGTEAQAAKLYYHASDTHSGLNTEIERRGQYYQDARGRPGNALDMDIILPISTARAIISEVRQDPVFIRRLVETFIRRKFSKEFIEKTWDKFGRPPYSAWSQYPVNKMVVVDGITHPLDGKLDPRAIDDKVVEFKGTN